MIERKLRQVIASRALEYPVITLLGPRQSGKTTLAKMAFPDAGYHSLEHPPTRDYALSDPEGFLQSVGFGVILDEIQRAPELLSFIQGIVDERKKPGDYILTGSQQLGLNAAVTQSLAGRTSIVNLYPPDFEELQRFSEHPDDLFETLFKGAYPPIYDRGFQVGAWLDDYIQTYVERDVRQILNVTDLTSFQTFLRLCAGRTAQTINLSSIAADAGVTHNTAKRWLSVLEASFIAIRLPAYHRNFRKRLVRAPKLHFVDTGLLCRLLGVRHPAELEFHPLRGAIFESWVVSEVMKHHANFGVRAQVYHWRDSSGHEVDLLIDQGATLIGVEAKSGKTITRDQFAGLQFIEPLVMNDPVITKLITVLVHGGDQDQLRRSTRAIPWSEIQAMNWYKG